MRAWVAALWLAGCGGHAAEPAPRVVAVGDVHGDLSAVSRALRAAGVVDPEGRWAGGDTIVVQTGDVLDRGTDEPDILAWFERLAVEAKAAGGLFIMLLGNHELMNVAGDWRYVVAPEGWTDFADIPVPEGDPALADVRPEARGRVVAFRPGGLWARQLADQPVAVIVGDTVFAHAGPVEASVPDGRASLDAWNAAARAWLEGGPQPAFARDPDGPVWTRAWGGPDPDCAALGRVLGRLDAQRLVVGHTPQAGGITSACDGRLWRIDTGMSAHYGGVPQAWVFDGGVVTIAGG